jgi:FixJ family two-component response regulator
MASKNLSSLKRVPWLLVFELARMTHGHLMDRTSPADRRRVMDLVKATHGDPRKLTQRERDELRAIARKLDVKQLAAALSPAVARNRLRR